MGDPFVFSLRVAEKSAIAPFLAQRFTNALSILPKAHGSFTGAAGIIAAGYNGLRLPVRRFALFSRWILFFYGRAADGQGQPLEREQWCLPRMNKAND